MGTTGLSFRSAGDSRVINLDQLTYAGGDAGADEEDVNDVQDCILKSRKIDDGDNNNKEGH